MHELIRAESEIGKWHQPGPPVRASWFVLTGMIGLPVTLCFLGHPIEAALCYLLFCGVGYARYRALDRLLARRGSEDDEIVKGVARFPHWLVYVRIQHKNAITGQDRGVLWEEEGVLHFVGDACSFTISPGDCVGMPPEKRTKWKALPHAIAIYVPGAFGATLVSFHGATLVDQSIDKTYQLSMALRSLLSNNHQIRSADPPPVSLGPGGYTALRYVEEVLVQLGLTLMVITVTSPLLHFLLLASSGQICYEYPWILIIVPVLVIYFMVKHFKTLGCLRGLCSHLLLRWRNLP